MRDMVGPEAGAVNVGPRGRRKTQGAAAGAAARQAREMAALRAEVRRLKGEKHKDQDEVLALLDEAS